MAKKIDYDVPQMVSEVFIQIKKHALKTGRTPSVKKMNQIRMMVVQPVLLKMTGEDFCKWVDEKWSPEFKRQMKLNIENMNNDN